VIHDYYIERRNQINTYRLKWNASSFNNSYETVIPATSLWLPDLNILNIADGHAGFIPVSSSNLAIVNNEGLVYVIFGISGLRTKCALNAYYYPFDKQNCSIIIGSWQLDTFRINFISSNDYVDLSNFIQNPVWILKHVDVFKVYTSRRFLSSFDYLSGDVGFFLILQRGSMYSMVNNVFPCLVLNIVILAAFYIPLMASQIALSR